MFYLQETGDRIYEYDRGIRLQKATITQLKYWNRKFGDISYDGKVCKMLLTEIFSEEILNMSTIRDKIGANETQLVALDEIKVQFVIDLLHIRIKDDADRITRVPKIIADHCDYVRKQRNKMKKSNQKKSVSSG